MLPIVIIITLRDSITLWAPTKQPLRKAVVCKLNIHLFGILKTANSQLHEKLSGTGVKL